MRKNPVNRFICSLIAMAVLAVWLPAGTSVFASANSEPLTNREAIKLTPASDQPLGQEAGIDLDRDQSHRSLALRTITSKTSVQSISSFDKTPNQENLAQNASRLKTNKIAKQHETK